MVNGEDQGKTTASKSYEVREVCGWFWEIRCQRSEKLVYFCWGC